MRLRGTSLLVMALLLGLVAELVDPVAALLLALLAPPAWAWSHQLRRAGHTLTSILEPHEAPADRVRSVVPDEVLEASARLAQSMPESGPAWAPAVLRREATVRLARGRLLAAARQPGVMSDQLEGLEVELQHARLAYWWALRAAGGEVPEEAAAVLDLVAREMHEAMGSTSDDGAHADKERQQAS